MLWFKKKENNNKNPKGGPRKAPTVGVEVETKVCISERGYSSMNLATHVVTAYTPRTRLRIGRRSIPVCGRA